ncbi:hypothetical protein PMAYCL1PPCAC_01366, partial [Pristionchus mayeri]
MLSRLTQSCRGLSLSSKHISKKIQQNGLNKRRERDRKEFLKLLLEQNTDKSNGRQPMDGSMFKNLLRNSTEQRPFMSGSASMVGLSALTIGALAFYGMRMGKESSLLQESLMWPQFVGDRLKSTCCYLAASIGVTAVAAVVASRAAFPSLLAYQ